MTLLKNMGKNICSFCILIFVGILFLQTISAECEEGQIDINIATIESLDEITYVGPATAEKIVDARPFDSVDDLISVSGIGEVKLQAIKDQGFACVKDSAGNDESAPPEVPQYPQGHKSIELGGNEEDTEEDEVLDGPQVIQPPIVMEVETIDLTKDIKTDEDSEILDKSGYALYGFVGFCVLIGSLFVLRRKRFNKNEFN
jgi:hypothetical protein